MLTEERRERILRELMLRGHVNVNELAARAGLSGMTIRRDLAVLAERGLVRRVHGGAVPTEAADAPVTGPHGIGTANRPLATVGLIVPDAAYYFRDVIRGVKIAAREAGLRLVLGVTNYTAAEESRQLKQLAAKGVDAILLVTATPGEGDAHTWETITALGVPVVLVERSSRDAPTKLSIDSVRSDHSYGAELALDHLAERGHRRVGLVCLDSATAPWIKSGYRRAARRLGLEADAPTLFVPAARYGGGSPRALLDEFLTSCRDTGTTAALVLPDDLAITLLSIAEERGIRVPEDFAIVAYDDEVASLANVPLTAVAPPKESVGRHAIEICLARLNDRDQGPMQRVELTPSLRVRESSSGSRDSAPSQA